MVRRNARPLGLEIDADLIEAMKQLAAQNDRSLTKEIERALRRHLAYPEGPPLPPAPYVSQGTAQAVPPAEVPAEAKPKKAGKPKKGKG